MPTDPTDANARLMKPINPHVLVLYGATGDLARRKLLPGLFHLSRAGLLPECRIIGTALDDIDDAGFRAHTRAALDEFARRPRCPTDEWEEFAACLSYVSQSGRLPRPRRRHRQGRTRPRWRRPAPLLPEHPAGGGARGARAAPVGGPRRARDDRVGEAVRHRRRDALERSTTRCTRRSTRARSSASTTSSGRRRRSTSSPSGSRTASSSRSGTASTSRTCRSTSPRRSGSSSASASTSRRARTATWS